MGGTETVNIPFAKKIKERSELSALKVFNIRVAARIIIRKFYKLFER